MRVACRLLLVLCAPLLAAASHGVLNCGMVTCPQQSSMIVERFGKYHRMLTPGLHFTWPWPLESLRRHELRERPYEVQRAPAITKDNVDLVLDAVVYLRVVDPYRANYAVDDPVTAMLILAQTTVRSRIGEMTLDQTFKNREELNAHVVSVLAQAGSEWGVVCTRYEVKDIDPPQSIMNAMKAEAEAERKKRAVILESEGVRQAAINRAEGEKAAAVLASEAQAAAAVNIAQGDAGAVREAAAAEAEQMLAMAKAKAAATEAVAEALKREGGDDAARFALASEYVKAFAQLGGRSSTLVVPQDAASVGSVVTAALAAVDAIPRSPAK